MSTRPAPRLPEDDGPVLFLPQVDVPHLSDTELTCDMRAAQGRQRREYALELEAVAQLAHRRRGRVLGTPSGRGGPGLDARTSADAVLADVGEDLPAELALTRNCSEQEARVLLRTALLLTTALVPTWSELYAGHIGARHVLAAVDLLGDAAPRVAAEVQARVLPTAEGMTAAEFRDRLRRALDRADAAARERRRRAAVRKADVQVWPAGPDAEGMSWLAALLPTPRALAARAAIDGYAGLRRADGDARPIGMLRAETAWDLLMRPWDTARPPVTAQLTVHAAAPALRPDGHPGQTQQPAEIDGQVLSAAQCRELLRDLDLLGLGDPPPGSSIQIAVGDPATGELLAVATRAQLRRAAGTGRRRTRRRAGVSRPGDAALVSATAPADGPGLAPPPDTAGYRPTAAQRRHVTTRDRTCRMPGCRRRPGRVDLDHGRPWHCGGPTACWNLCCLCRTHHRIKTFARGWTFHLLRDGRLLVRTPAGVTRLTRPPGWHIDPEPTPAWLDETAPPDPMLT